MSAGEVVVDSSLAVKWLLQEELSDAALDALGYWTGAGSIHAPFLLPAEITNAVFQRIRRGELTRAQALGRLDDLERIPMTLHETERLHQRALEIASELGHGAAYDAHYVALAEAIGAECWTADGRLHRSAVSAYPFVRLLGEDAG